MNERPGTLTARPPAPTPAQLVLLALRALRRDWRAGELRVLTAALIIAVAGTTSVGFFTDRIQRAMQMQAAELLAADLVVVSTAPIEARLEDEALRRGLATARSLGFPSMLVSQKGLKLADVKAVSPGYPLRGELRVSERPFAETQVARSGPGRGAVWLDPRLVSALGLQVGDTVSVGEASLRVDRVLSYEPDRGGDLFSIAPRLLMHLDDVPGTGLVQTGSRVKHRLLVAGEPNAMAAYRTWVKSRLARGESLQSVRDARPEMRLALERAERFLSLAALSSVVLAGLAVAVATRRYAQRHLDPVAIMRCLGASRGLVLRLLLLQMALVGLLAGALGSLAGFGAQQGLVAILGNLLPANLPAPSLAPLLSGLAISLITLFGFALPTLLRLGNVSPLRVLRRDLAPLPPKAWLVYLAGMGSLGLLVLWQSADTALAAYTLAGTALTLFALSLGALLLIRGLRPLRGRVGTAWRFGLASISRRANASVLQVMAFGLGIMVLLLLTLVRGELLENWQRRLPADAPNLFLINIQPGEVQAVQAFLQDKGVRAPGIYPMVRGRLVAIDGHQVAAEDYENPRARRLVEREFNLSWAERPQSGNRIVAGRWWDASDGPQAAFSVEQGLAETLGIELGDALSFNVAGQTVEARVSNLRSVQWDSFQVNFFVLAPPGVLEGAPATYITSFHLPAQQHELLSALVDTFPSVTVLDVEALMGKVRGIIAQATLAVEYVFLFTLLAGLVVLAAAIQSTLDERRYESAIIRTLGGSRRQLVRGLLAEFMTLGALAGVLAAAAATGIGWVLSYRVFDMPYQPSAVLWLYGLLGGTLGVGLAGLLGTRSVLSHPPIESLRER